MFIKSFYLRIHVKGHYNNHVVYNIINNFNVALFVIRSYFSIVRALEEVKLKLYFLIFTTVLIWVTN